MDRHGRRPAPGASERADRTRSITIPALAECVSDARRTVTELLVEHGVPSVIVEDLQLVASELVTNGVMYGLGDSVTVEVHIEEGPPAVAELTVSNAGPIHGIPAVDEWRPAPPTAATGRGLGIVRRLSDEVAVHDVSGQASIVVRRRLPDSGDGVTSIRPPDSVP